MCKLIINRYIFIFSAVFIFNNSFSQNVVVWDFTDRERNEDEITRSLTHEFEEALNEYSPFRAIDERDKDRFLASFKAANGYSTDSPELKEFVSNNQIEMYVYGEFHDDIEGGQASIKVTFESLKREKIIIKSVLMRRGLLRDPQSRRAKMIELVALINNTDVVAKKIESKYFKEDKISEKEEIDTSYIRKILQEEADVIISYCNIGYPPSIGTNTPSDFDKYKTYYSFDGKEYYLLDSHSDTELKENNYGNLYVKYVSYDSLVVVGPILKEKAFLTAAKEAVKSRITWSLRDIIECDTRGCELNGRFFVGSYAKNLKIKNKNTNKQTEINIDKFKNLAFNNQDLCLTPIADIFVCNPNDEIVCTLIYDDKTEISFETIVEAGYAPIDPNGKGRMGNWLKLDKYNLNDKNEYPIFYISAAGFRKVLECYVGIGKCENKNFETSPISVLFDIDGKGMVELGVAHDSRYEINIPTGDKIGISIDLKSGKRLGPFYYRFNLEDILQATSDMCDEPRLRVTYNHELKKYVASFEDRLICLRNVSGIIYGDSQDNMKEFLPISISDQQIINMWFKSHYRDNPEVKKPFINPPDSVENLYYKIIFKDNRESKVIRLNMK